MSKPAYIGIQVARALVSGDVSRARVLANGRTCWRVCEARAILGAGRYIERMYGAPKFIGESVLGWSGSLS
jgi:hypothetical protein